MLCDLSSFKMTWAEENHCQRVKAENRRLRLARKGVRLEERGNADMFPVVAIAGMSLYKWSLTLPVRL